MLLDPVLLKEGLLDMLPLELDEPLSVDLGVPERVPEVDGVSVPAPEAVAKLDPDRDDVILPDSVVLPVGVGVV